MLDDLQHQWRLWRLQARKDRISTEYRKIQNKARKEKKNQEEIDRIVDEGRFENNLIDDEILQLQSQYLLNRAEKYLLPRPEFKTQDGAWEQSEITGSWRLSRAALLELRTKVRNEQKERREHWQSWLGALTGLIGALIGLLSIW